MRISIPFVFLCLVGQSISATAVEETTRANVREGATALLRGQTGQAVNQYTTALRDKTLAKDRRATILNDRAVAYVRLGKTKKAIEDFNRAVELFPEYAVVYNNRGNLLLALGLYEEAYKDFNRSIALAPGYAAAYNNRAGAQMRLGNTDGAIRDYTHAIKLMPSNPASLSGRGRVHLVLGRPHAAIRDFSRAVGADARFAAGYRNRAEAKLEVEHYTEAIEDLSRAIAFDVANPEVYLLRGHAYLATNDGESAIRDFTRVIELSPNSALGYEARGLSYALLGALEEAFGDLNLAVDRNPRSSTAFAYRAYAYTTNQQLDIAARDIATAEKLDKENPEAQWAKAEMLDAMGRSDEAIEYLRKAIRLRPGFKRAVDTMGRLGVADPFQNDQIMKNLGIKGWRVVVRSGRYYAVYENYDRIRIPLELIGKGKPRLLSWQLQPRPFRKIGVLKFSAGVLEENGKKIVVEQAAIVDLREAKIVAIEPERRGEKRSNWTWNPNGTVTIASIDGVTDEFALRDAYRPRKPTYTARRAKPRPKRRRKPKSLFELLFSN